MRKLGKTIPLTFQRSWLNEYKWLAYSPSQGGGYCKYCVLFSSASTEKLGVFVKTPFKNFSKAKGKGFLNKHQLNEYHQDAVCKSMTFLERFVNPDTRIDTILENQSTDISNRNKHILFVIVEGIKLCGMQCLPLRSHRDDSTAECFTNRGNFLAILEYAYRSDPIIKEHIEKGKKNPKSMHQKQFKMKSSM